MRSTTRSHIGLLLAAVAFVAAAALGGCSDNGKSSGGGTDAGYVAAICQAQLKLRDGYLNATKNLASSATSADFIKAVTPALEQYFEALKATKPPPDVQPYHDVIVGQFQEALTKFRANDPNALEGIDPKKAPPEIAARLQKIANSNLDCDHADFRFDQ